jgi:hypothetical protein
VRCDPFGSSWRWQWKIQNWNSLPLAATPANRNDCVAFIHIDLLHGCGTGFPSSHNDMNANDSEV